ncbi:Uncharacterised protein [Bordetella ansorpii]|uniref:Uncharacterized protein n=1 Tax=Bordetella ansorpii TaxID=288768 RepID=A0A157S583_9BORD|nr:Uncharacterised protein [Bordetella ansorpii]
MQCPFLIRFCAHKIVRQPRRKVGPRWRILRHRQSAAVFQCNDQYEHAADHLFSARRNDFSNVLPIDVLFPLPAAHLQAGVVDNDIDRRSARRQPADKPRINPVHDHLIRHSCCLLIPFYGGQPPHLGCRHFARVMADPAREQSANDAAKHDGTTFSDFSNDRNHQCWSSPRAGPRRASRRTSPHATCSSRQAPHCAADLFGGHTRPFTRRSLFNDHADSDHFQDHSRRSCRSANEGNPVRYCSRLADTQQDRFDGSLPLEQTLHGG